VVQNLYTQFLRRTVDAGGLATFTTALGNGATIEQVEEALVSSTEYFQSRGNGTNDGFLSALYQDALKRSIDPTGQATFDKFIQNGGPRAQVATAIFTSTEFRQDLVQGYYQTFLHRAADTGGQATFVALLKAGKSDQEVIADIVGSPEFFGRLG